MKAWDTLSEMRWAYGELSMFLPYPHCDQVISAEIKDTTVSRLGTQPLVWPEKVGFDERERERESE